MFRFPEPLKEGTIVSRPNRFIMLVRTRSGVIRCHCPTTGRLGDLDVSGLPCLYSRQEGSERKTSWTVEAVSPSTGRARRWIGINQTAANRYVEHFLREGQLERMAAGDVKREVKLGKSRIDFLVGDAFVEVKTPLIRLPAAEGVRRMTHGRFDSFDRLIKHMTELRRSLSGGRRAVLAMCYLYDAEPFSPPKETKYNSRVVAASRLAEEAGVERWQINMRVTKQGVSIVRYFRNVSYSGAERVTA